MWAKCTLLPKLRRLTTTEKAWLVGILRHETSRLQVVQTLSPSLMIVNDTIWTVIYMTRTGWKCFWSVSRSLYIISEYLGPMLNLIHHTYCYPVPFICSHQLISSKSTSETEEGYKRMFPIDLPWLFWEQHDHLSSSALGTLTRLLRMISEWLKSQGEVEYDRSLLALGEMSEMEVVEDSTQCPNIPPPSPSTPSSATAISLTVFLELTCWL